MTGVRTGPVGPGERSRDVRAPRATAARDAGAFARRVRSAAAVGVAAFLLLAVAACGSGGTTEVSGGPGTEWEALGEVPAPTLPDGSPAPQVMAEVTLPDGAVPTVPQPAVPVVAPPTTVPSAPAPTAPTPSVLASPAPGASGPLPSVQLPPSLPGGAQAVERLGDDALRSVAARALSRVRFDWRSVLAGWQVRFLPGRKGLRGSTFPDARVIEVYVRSSDDVAGLSHVIAHEMGHAVDVSRLGDVQRAAWKAARGVDANAAWFPAGDGASDYASPAGDWAESFARWQTGVGWYSQVGPPPTPVQTALMASLAGLA
jgi:hypothetical protein